jgi:hypothetical protein
VGFRFARSRAPLVPPDTDAILPDRLAHLDDADLLPGRPMQQIRERDEGADPDEDGDGEDKPLSAHPAGLTGPLHQPS